MIGLIEYDLVPDTKINTRKLTAKRTINAQETYAAQNYAESPLLVQLDSMGQFGFAEVFGKENVFKHAEKMHQKGKQIFNDGKEILSQSKDILQNAERAKEKYQPLINDAVKYVRIKNDCIFKNKKFPKDNSFDYKTDTKTDEEGRPVYKIIWNPSDTIILRTKDENGSYIEIRGNKSGIKQVEISKNNSARKRGDFKERYSFFNDGTLNKYEEGFSKKEGFEDGDERNTETTAKIYTFIDNKLNTFLSGKQIKALRYATDVNSKGVYSFDYNRDGNLIAAKIGQRNDSIKEEYYFEDGKPREIRLKKDGDRYGKIITYKKDGSIDKIQEECKYSYL